MRSEFAFLNGGGQKSVKIKETLLLRCHQNDPKYAEIKLDFISIL